MICLDTILMLFRSTSPSGDRASPPPVHLSVSDLPPPSSPCFTAELNGPCLLRHIHTMRRRFGDRSAGGSVPSPSQLDQARTRDQVGSGIISGTNLNYPGSGSKFGSREPGYPLTSLVKRQCALTVCCQRCRNDWKHFVDVVALSRCTWNWCW